MLNREKIDVYSEDPDKFNIMALLYETLYKFLLMLAPVNPMLTEKLYLEMYHPFLESMGKQKTKSIHLQEWPKLEEMYIDEDLESQMEFVRELIEVIRSIKNEQRIRLRWPNKRLIIVPKETMPELKLDHLVKDMTNIKEIQVKDSVQESDKLVKAESRYGDLYLDVSVDDAIIAERVENDLLRNIQYTRKKNDLKVGEPIDLIIGTKKESLRKELENHKEEIASKVSADKIEIELNELEEKPEFIYNEINLCPNQKCHASLKVNIMKKVEDNRDVTCPYCGKTLKHEGIIDVSFQFKRL
jgi:isoleucyl-tRNA synthetase